MRLLTRKIDKIKEALNEHIELHKIDIDSFYGGLTAEEQQREPTYMYHLGLVGGLYVALWIIERVEKGSKEP